MFALEKLQIENSGEVDRGFIFDVIVPFDTNYIVDSEALEHFANELRSACCKEDKVYLSTFRRNELLELILCNLLTFASCSFK